MKSTPIGELLGIFAFLFLLSTGSSSHAQVADAGPDQTVAAGESCDALVTLDASATIVPEERTATYTWTGNFPEEDGTVMGEQVTVTLPLGESEITLTVENDLAEISTDTVLITVEDQTPPVITSITASPDRLWPPNHKMADVDVQVEVSDNCDDSPVCKIISITSNEPVNGRGDGNTVPDWRITGDLTALVRAERAGPGNGRKYTITVECSDSSENTTTAEAIVSVPHDQGDDDEDGDDDDGDDDGDDEPVREDRTKVAFKINFKNQERNRFLAKLDVAETVGALPAIGTSSICDDVAGYDLILEIGLEEFSDTFDETGRIRTEDLRARLTCSGYLVVDVRDLDLPDILDLDPADSLRGAEVMVSITATVIPPEGVEGVASEPVILYDDILMSTYSQKPHRKGKGKFKRERERRS